MCLSFNSFIGASKNIMNTFIILVFWDKPKNGNIFSRMTAKWLQKNTPQLFMPLSLAHSSVNATPSFLEWALSTKAEENTYSTHKEFSY